MITFLKRCKRFLQKANVHVHVIWYRIFGKALKLDIGAGTNHYHNWIATDQPTLDITRAADWNRYFKKGSIDRVLAEHVFEHLTLEESRIAFVNIYDHLKPNGVFRVAVPDGNHPSQYVINLVQPGGLEEGADDHKVLYTIDILTKLAKEIGFSVRPLEYFDTNGVFHAQEYDIALGYIHRNAKNYRGRFTTEPSEMQKMLDTTPAHLRAQFIGKKMSYTSLLMDFIKTTKEAT